MFWDLEDIRIKNEWCMSQTAAEIAKERQLGYRVLGVRKHMSKYALHIHCLPLLDSLTPPYYSVLCHLLPQTRGGDATLGQIYISTSVEGIFGPRVGHLPSTI